ncbi:MAG: ATP-binding protein [Coriobacteriia bacterium]|nr:ATP-binding protein [Coriobacteriia bacterium]
MRSIRHVTVTAVLATALLASSPAVANATTAGTAGTSRLALTHAAALVGVGTVLLLAIVYCVRREASIRASELRQAIARQRAIIDAIPDLLFRMDGDGRFLEFKPSPDFEPPCPPDELLGKTVRELAFPSGMVIHWEAVLETVRRDGGYRSLEYQLDYPDGVHEFEARIVQATPGEYLAIIRDISARKQAETDSETYRRQLEQTVTQRTSDLIEANIRLQEANRAKSAFLSKISHELRTPLNSIIGFPDILLKGLAGDMNEEQRRQLTMVQEAGKRLLSLVEDVLDYTMIESGRVTALPVDFRLAHLLEDCVAQVRTKAASKGLDIELDAGHAPTTMHGDRGLLERVVLTLLSNAIKFTEEGSVTVRAYPVDEDRVVIEVADTGIGIDPALADNVFHAFEQSANRLKVKPQGLGLGLAVCHQLTQLLSGTIELESEPDAGTTARLTVPLRLEVPGAEPSAEA